MNRFTKLWIIPLLLIIGGTPAVAAPGDLEIPPGGLAPSSTLCAGAVATLSYTLQGSYGGGNRTFNAFLSDASGSFSNSVLIGSTLATNDGSFSVTIPASATTSSSYKIRIITSEPDTSNEFSVTVNASPVVTLTPSLPGNRCVGTTVTYTTESGGGSSYVWAISGTANTDYTLVTGGTASSNTAEITWLTSGAKSVSVNYSNGTCTAPAPTTLNFTIGAVPTATFIAPPAGGVCTNTPTVYTTQGGAGFSNYSWTNTGTLGVDYTLNSGGDATSNTASITWLNPGSYTVTVNYSDANNCASAAPASTTTTVNGRPTASFTTQPAASVCANNAVTYTTQTGGGITAYVWNIPGTPTIDYTLTIGTGDPLSNTAVVTWHTGGTKTVTVNYLDINSCPALTAASNTTDVISTVATPSFVLGASSTRCQGAGNITYEATALGSTAMSYALDATSLAAGNTINATTGEVTYLSGWTGPSTITATATGCNGPTTAPHTVTTTPTVSTPAFSLGATSTRCQGAGSTTYAASVSDGVITFTLDAASLTAGNTINSSTGQVTYTTNWSGTSIITATATGCNGPTTATHTVQIVGVPIFASGLTSTRCQAFEALAYPASSVNGGALTYTISGGLASAIISDSIVLWDPGFAGTAVVIATTNACGSPLSAIHTVTVNPAVGPTSFTLAPLTPCQGSVVNYDAQADHAASTVYSIVTTPGGNAAINSSTGVVTFNPSFVGTAVVTATSSGCGSPTSSSQNIVITPVVTQPVFNSGPSNTICQAPGIITYTATASNTVGPMVYSRSPASAGTINSATGQMSFNPSFVGLATITATATGCNGISTNTFVVDVKATVGVPVFDSGAATIRKQGAATILYSATATNSTGMSYALSPASAGNISATGLVTLNAAFSGTATITATAFGCNVTPTSTHTLTVVQTPVYATASSTRCQQGSAVTYTATSNGTVTYYVSTTPNDPGTTINSATGAVTFSAGFFGNAIIKAVAKIGAVVTDTAQHFVTVNVAPRLTSTTLDHALCSGNTTAITLVATTGSGSVFNFTTLGGANISGKNGGTGNSITHTLTNVSNSSPDSFFYEIVITSPAPASCPSIIKDSIKVRVNPKPVLTAIAPVTICSESNINISLGASTTSTFLWSVSAPAKIEGELPGGGNIISQKLDNTDVSLSPTAATATYSITPTSLFGCAGNPGTALVTVNPLPVVSFASGPSKTICSDDQTGISLSANIASSFAWVPITLTSLNLITGQNAGSGTTINYTLVNSSNSVVDSIGYSVTPTTTGGSPTCVGKPQLVVVRVNPKPAMTTASNAVVCSQTPLSTALSATIPSTFNWVIGTVRGGITGQAPNSGSVTSITQTLVNPSFDTAGSVDYIITPSSNTLPSCTGAADTITVTVNPQPKLISDLTRTICSDATLDYEPKSSVVSGTTIFMYTRESLAPSIKNLSQRSTVRIFDTLSTDFILTPASVDYNFLLESAAGCKLGDQHLTVTVNPTPDTTGLSVFPLTRVCSGATSLNFSTRRTPDDREFFKWTATNAGIPIQKVDSSFSQNALISFPSAGDATVNIISTARGFNCPSKTTSKIVKVASAGGNQAVNVVFFANNLVAQVSGAKGYQWGFDRKLDLDSTIITGETAQSYDTRKGFNTGANLYWVMVTFTDDCVQKAYFNAPALGVTPTASLGNVEMKMFPNPVQDVLNLEVTGTQARDLVYELYDLAGKRLYQAPGGSKTRIPVRELAPGYYVVTCIEAGVRVATSRFIKN